MPAIEQQAAAGMSALKEVSNCRMRRALTVQTACMLAPTLFARCQIIVLYGEICGLPVEILEHSHDMVPFAGGIKQQ